MAGHSKWSEIRREVTPDLRARLDEIKAEMVAGERLAAIRSSVGLTQVEVASRLDIAQGNVSQLERREDLLVSTLRQYVEALGGSLELAAVFPERRYVITIGGPTETGDQG